MIWTGYIGRSRMGGGDIVEVDRCFCLENGG